MTTHQPIIVDVPLSKEQKLRLILKEILDQMTWKRDEHNGNYIYKMRYNFVLTQEMHEMILALLRDEIA